MDSSPINENAVIIYSPSSCSKPAWIPFFCWAQRYFEELLVTKQLAVAIDFHSMEKNNMEFNGYRQLFGY